MRSAFHAYALLGIHERAHHFHCRCTSVSFAALESEGMDSPVGAHHATPIGNITDMYSFCQVVSSKTATSTLEEGQRSTLGRKAVVPQPRTPIEAASSYSGGERAAEVINVSEPSFGAEHSSAAPSPDVRDVSSESDMVYLCCTIHPLIRDSASVR